MTFYEFLLEEKATGHFQKWLQMGAPSQLPKWMEIKTCELTHPDLSQEELADLSSTSSSTIQRALAFMNQQFI